MKIKVVMKSVLDSSLSKKSKEELANIVQQLLLEEKLKNDDGFLNRFFVKNKARQIKEIVDVIEKMQNFDDNNVYTPFDNNFNKIVAGLMGSTCYMKDDFDKLYSKTQKQILRISNTVLTGGHHSTFDHAHLTLQINDIPKALAMVLNNEKEYTTAEKSARYTVMNNLEPESRELYEKWVDIFKQVIDEKYGSNRPFFDEKGIKVKKLSQENARYLIPITTPTNMVYTTSYRQLNYLCHWLREESKNPSNLFYEKIKDDMADFVNQIDDMGLFLQELQDGKDRKLSLFGDGVLEDRFSNTYQQEIKMSFACLAQKQRHRTINFNIVEDDFVKDCNNMDNLKVYVPPIIKGSELQKEFEHDFEKVKESLPQGTIVNCAESGTFDDFKLLAKERLCSCAQKEIRDMVFSQAKEYKVNLEKDKIELSKKVMEKIHSLDRENSSFVENLDTSTEIEKLEKQISRNDKLIKELNDLTKGARCMSNYKCSSPCGFKEGITLESSI